MVRLSEEQQALLQGNDGEAAAASMRIVVGAAELLGAERLIPIVSAHIDACLYLGDSGTEFAEFLVRNGGRVRVPATLNVGALDLLRPDNVRLRGDRRDMAFRHMKAYQDLGCRATWTCSPYQAGHRPESGAQVAWGESNAVAFCNSVLGARTNRYGDFLDIACALTGFAPEWGLHVPENRAATILIRTRGISERLKGEDAFWPVLGALVGKRVGASVAAIDDLAPYATEDRLKAFGAAAASFGSVALFHVIGVTPEAASSEAAFQGVPPREIMEITRNDVRAALQWLSTAAGNRVTAVGIGSPHLSLAEFEELCRLLAGRKVRLPFYANTGRHVVQRLEERGALSVLEAAGITIVADTCIVTTPIIQDASGVLMTNSGKFANYAPATIGHEVLYGSLSDCVETAVAGRLVRDAALWN